MQLIESVITLHLFQVHTECLHGQKHQDYRPQTSVYYLGWESTLHVSTPRTIICLVESRRDEHNSKILFRMEVLWVCGIITMIHNRALLCVMFQKKTWKNNKKKTRSNSGGRAGLLTCFNTILNIVNSHSKSHNEKEHDETNKIRERKQFKETLHSYKKKDTT